MLPNYIITMLPITMAYRSSQNYFLLKQLFETTTQTNCNTNKIANNLPVRLLRINKCIELKLRLREFDSF